MPTKRNRSKWMSDTFRNVDESIERQKCHDCRNDQPQQSLHQKKHEAPETEALDPNSDLPSRHALELKKISAVSVCRGCDVSSERTKMYIAQHSIANGGKPRKPSTGISKSLTLPK